MTASQGFGGREGQDIVNDYNSLSSYRHRTAESGGDWQQFDATPEQVRGDNGGCSVQAATNAPAPFYRRRTRTLESVPVNDRWYKEAATGRLSSRFQEPKTILGSQVVRPGKTATTPSARTWMATKGATPLYIWTVVTSGGATPRR